MREMPFTYTIAPEENIVYAKGEGMISLADLRAHMQTVNQDPLFRAGMNAIADLRDTQIVMNLQDVPDLIRLFIQQASIRKRGRWAVVIRRHPEVHLIRFFVTFMENLPFQLRVFGKSQEALHWLRESGQESAHHAQ